MILVGTFSIANAQDHQVSAAGQLGWALPGGAGVGEEAEDAYDVDGGLAYQGDVLYHLMDNKLRVGLGYTGTILASVSGTLSAYGMTTIGAKGLYYVKPEGFSPFGGLTLGVSTLETPETSINGQVTNPAEKGSGFAIQPTVGLAFGGFYISADYLIPTNIKLKDDPLNREGKIGYLAVNLGYRYTIDF